MGEDRHAVLSVTDTGIGIPDRELPHIFERFHRVEGAKGRTREGSGIGLALVAELVRIHGGTLTVQSQLGKGTTFRASIPFGSAHLPPDRIGAGLTNTPTAIPETSYVAEALRWLPNDVVPGSIPNEPAAPTGLRLLIADDNADMREYLARFLAPYFEIDAVSDGKRGPWFHFLLYFARPPGGRARGKNGAVD